MLEDNSEFKNGTRNPPPSFFCREPAHRSQRLTGLPRHSLSTIPLLELCIYSLISSSRQNKKSMKKKI